MRRRVRLLTWLFIIGLVASGATAIPIETGVGLLARWFDSPHPSALGSWVLTIYGAVHDTNQRYPFLAYGTDWLAFGHFAIAVAFIGPLRDPVRNVWVFTFGMIACVLTWPYALIFGGLRGIPLFWRAIDCSFGFFGLFPLWLARRDALELERRGLAALSG